jgi:transcriptional regulator NrdR family protein
MSVCIKCGLWTSKVLQTRKQHDAGWIRRERRCDTCGERWGTLEVPEVDVRQPPAPRSDEPC